MTDTVDTLPDDPQLLKQMLSQTLARLNYLEEQFRLAQHKAFGASSEAHPGQGELFNEPEVLVDEVVTDQAVSTKPTTARQRPVRKPLPQDLPREQVVVDIADHDKVCDDCQGQLHQIGEDSSEKLEFIPAKVKVIETIRPKYACRHCDKNGESVQVKQAPPLPAIIPKGIATPSLLSQIATSKYQYALPLYRQEAMFNQYGIDLSRQTMAQWMLRCADSLQGLYQHLKTTLLQQPLIHADETPLNVLKEDKHQCYMWLYCSGSDSPPPHSAVPNIVLYDYQPSRAGQCPVDFLQGYQGYLQVDGYAGYQQTQANLVGCWAHARRKFIEAKNSQPKGKVGKADMALSFIQKLYGIERQCQHHTPSQKHQARQQHALPILAKLQTWLAQSATQAPPQSSLGKAISYTLKQWPKLCRYTQDGRLNIDNNRAERAIKPFVIGRKNWMFANTPKGARASALLYSIIETAKANGLTPFDYLNTLFTELPTRKSNDDIADLLPWNVNLK